jgi:hypothetical protein
LIGDPNRSKRIQIEGDDVFNVNDHDRVLRDDDRSLLPSSSRKMSEKKTTKIRLSSKRLSQLPENCYENDFRFIVGGREHHCPCWVADFISPRISRLRSSDMTIRSFHLNLKELTASIPDFDRSRL